MEVWGHLLGGINSTLYCSQVCSILCISVGMLSVQVNNHNVLDVYLAQGSHRWPQIVQSSSEGRRALT